MPKLTFFSDGGARGNPGPAAIGVIAVNEDHEVVAEYNRAIGVQTNNIAEYLGLIAAHEMALSMGVEEPKFVMDSELVIKQMLGQYKVKDAKMKDLYGYVKEKDAQFKSVRYEHRRREDPFMKIADSLVNDALDAM